VLTGGGAGVRAGFLRQAGLMAGLQVGQVLRCSSYLGSGSAVPAPMFKGKNITLLSKKIFMFYLILLLNTVITHSVVPCKSNYMRNMYCILK